MKRCNAMVSEFIDGKAEKRQCKNYADDSGLCYQHKEQLERMSSGQMSPHAPALAARSPEEIRAAKNSQLKADYEYAKEASVGFEESAVLMPYEYIPEVVGGDTVHLVHPKMDDGFDGEVLVYPPAVSEGERENFTPAPDKVMDYEDFLESDYEFGEYSAGKVIPWLPHDESTLTPAENPQSQEPPADNQRPPVSPPPRPQQQQQQQSRQAPPQDHLRLDYSQQSPYVYDNKRFANADDLLTYYSRKNSQGGRVVPVSAAETAAGRQWSSVGQYRSAKALAITAEARGVLSRAVPIQPGLIEDAGEFFDDKGMFEMTRSAMSPAERSRLSDGGWADPSLGVSMWAFAKSLGDDPHTPFSTKARARRRAAETINDYMLQDPARFAVWRRMPVESQKDMLEAVSAPWELRLQEEDEEALFRSRKKLEKALYRRKEARAKANAGRVNGRSRWRSMIPSAATMSARVQSYAAMIEVKWAQTRAGRRSWLDKRLNRWSSGLNRMFGLVKSM